MFIWVRRGLEGLEGAPGPVGAWLVAVALTGNVHASTQQGVSWDKDFRPLGWHLEQAGEQVRAFDVLHQGGAARKPRVATPELV